MATAQGGYSPRWLQPKVATAQGGYDLCVSLKVANVQPSGAKAQQWVGAIVASDYNSVTAKVLIALSWACTFVTLPCIL